MMDKGANFSRDKLYRYTLHRIWAPKKKLVCFIGLNPSTADENIDDPTIRRCIGYAESWGYGGFYMLNIFAFRSTSPKVLPIVKDPVGMLNDASITATAKVCAITICCWGNHGQLHGRGDQVLSLIRDPYCLRVTGKGQPSHPLYLPKKLRPIVYKAR